jgi:hypothetical protein
MMCLLEPVRPDDRVDQIEKEENPDDSRGDQFDTHVVIIGTAEGEVNLGSAKP